MRRQELHPRTEVLNQKEKNRSKLARLKALAWLATKFPDAFCNETKIRPLKIGIIYDIMEYADEAAKDGISKSKLREAVVVFTRRVDYLTCLKAKEMRINLFGTPSEEVSAEEAEKAAHKIKKRVEKSARNARKNLQSKPLPTKTSYESPRNTVQKEFSDYFSFPDRPPAYSAHHAQTTTQNASSVVVKRRATKAYDPDAVARLKAKLGLSRKEEPALET